MTLTQLEIFSLVAELRGFTLAAHRLGISQSAVSHAMKALEQELGVELLRRHQSPVELSDIGEQLLLRARAMLGLANTLRQEAADARGMKSGTLRIGSFGPTSSIKLLPKILRRYREAHPGIEVHIDEGPGPTSDPVARRAADRHRFCGAARRALRHLCADRRPDGCPAPCRSSAGSAIGVELSRTCATTRSCSPRPVLRNWYRGCSGPRACNRTFAIAARNCSAPSTPSAVAMRMTIVAEGSLPDEATSRYVKKPLLPAVQRQVGLAVLDQRQASPATLAFIELASRMNL